MNLLRILGLAALVAAPIGAWAQINTVQTVAPEIFFHEGDPRRGHSNNGWVIFDDYVVVIDANYPSGAKEVMPKVKASSPKPIRFVIDTHQHADHAYGNQLWADEGATLVAHTGVLAALREASAAADWEASAKKRPDVAATTLKLPSVLYPDTLVFDDGHRRMELHWLGVAHTKGDTFLWLPKEKVLFTGDACVNGPQNNMRDGDSGEWIKTLEAAKKFGAEKVCPGHGPMGGPEIIVDQQAYFVALRRAVQELIDAKKTPLEVRDSALAMATSLKRQPNIARYVPAALLPHLSKVYQELSGAALPLN
jgi:glyoxylase-like metal-dependent hydrolase (beta-lactamase superfamily II)